MKNVKSREKKLHLALYLPSLRGGGAERVMVNLANGFSQRGIKVDLVLANAEGPYLDDVSSAVEIVDLFSKRVSASLPGLTRYLKKNKPQAMLSTMGHANIIAILARKLAGMEEKMRLVVREAITISYDTRKTNKPLGRLIPQLTRFFYPWADEIIANSSGSAYDLATLTGLPVDSIHIIANPIDIDAIRDYGKTFPNHPWFHSDEYQVILATGRLTEQKGFDVLIKAFLLVNKKKPDTRLIILGEGEKRQELNELVKSLGIADKVSLPGFMNNPYSYMNHSTLFVLSSRWEGLPNALLEALTLGTPIVATKCPSGPSEILENGKYGKLVPVDDYNELANAILTTLSTPPDRQTLKARANNFSIDKIVDECLNILLP